jgi:hypothetical protein
MSPPELDLAGLLPERSAEDILSGRVRLTFGDKQYELPVLKRGASRRWKEQIDARIIGLIGSLDASGDNIGAIVGILAGASDQLVELLRAYDETGVLPDPETLDEEASDIDILRAVLEVWAAANPLAALAVVAATRSLKQPTPTNGLSPPSSSAPPSTAGRRRRSKRT